MASYSSARITTSPIKIQLVCGASAFYAWQATSNTRLSAGKDALCTVSESSNHIQAVPVLTPLSVGGVKDGRDHIGSTNLQQKKACP